MVQVAKTTSRSLRVRISFRRRVGLAIASLAAVLAAATAVTPPSEAALGDPVIAAAGDIACDPTVSWFNGGRGTATDCRQMFTASLLNGADAVLPIGDEQYNCGGGTAFANSYDPSWGQQKAVSHPVPGNHEYWTTGGSDCSSQPDAAPYYRYFGAAAGDPTKGWYSFDLGSWHIIALNSECGYVTSLGSCGSGSAQEAWLRNDLAAHSSAPCTMAYWHRPRFASTTSGGDKSFTQWWVDLYNARADVVLNGHAHWYERFAPQDPSGAADAQGIRQFIVGTGGEESGSRPDTRLPNNQAIASGLFGVLKMTLHPGSYDWTFVKEANSSSTFNDSGTTACHNAAPTDTVAPTTSIACNGQPCLATEYADPVTVTLSAADTGGAGVQETRYTTDGSDPQTSGTAVTYTGALTVAQSTIVRFASTDNAGNHEAPQSQQIQVASAQVDTTPPATSVTCDGSACSTGWYRTGTTVALTAADTGGSGLDKTLYTLDGTDPWTSATATTYTAPFTVPQTMTVTFASVDRAGNREGPRSQMLRIDRTNPTVSITSPVSGLSFRRGTTIQIAASATDTESGSGVSTVAFYRDGTKLSADNTAPYTASWSVPKNASGSHSLTAVAIDRAGNTATSPAVNVNITR